MSKARILIADDHDVVRSGLRLLLRSQPDFAVVAEARDGEEALRLAAAHHPDIALLDISMPRLDGIETTKRLKERLPDVKTVILSVHEGEEYASRVLRAGACGYLLKNAGRKEIFHALRLVLRGEQYFSPGVSAAIVRGFLRTADGGPAEGGAGAAPTADPARLTARELEVLRYIAQGFTNRQIAEELSLSFRTINTHRTNIMEKLDIHDTAGLVRHAIGLGLISIG